MPLSPKLLPLAAILLLAALLGWLLFGWQPPPGGDAAGREPHGGDFVLTRPGQHFDTRELRGKVVLLYFGYTGCPDICPTSLAYLGQALKQLTPEELERVQGLFVSVDPDRDTPERLAAYAAYFHPRIRGVSGSAEEVDRAVALYGAAYRKVDRGSAGGYQVDHTSFTYLIAPDGTLRERFPHGTPSERIAAAVRAVPAAGR